MSPNKEATILGVILIGGVAIISPLGALALVAIVLVQTLPSKRR